MADKNRFSLINRDDDSGKLESGNAVPIGIQNRNDSATTVVTNNEFGQGSIENTVLSFFDTFNNEEELIRKYDEMSIDPYVADALADILDEIVVYDRNKNTVELNLDSLDKKELPEATKKKIQEEFVYLLNILNFNNDGYDLVKDWYVRGKQYHYPVVDKTKKTIIDVYQLSQDNVKKINHITYKNESKSGRMIKVIDKQEKFFIYKMNEKHDDKYMQSHWVQSDEAFKFPEESIIQVDSGLYDKSNNLILSNLHPAIKSFNQLNQSEDAMVIYRMVRAPEKRAFYIDVGNLGKTASEKYMNGFISKFKTIQNYNAATGKLNVGSKGIQSIYQDYWLPRKGNQTSEITTLDAAQNLGELTDVEYLKGKLYTALKIPHTRLDPEARYSLGRAAEIERDEFKFHKFVDRLRNRYSKLFVDILRLQCHIKGIILMEDFDLIKNKIFIDWSSDNFYEEIKDQEILSARLETISNIESLQGNYFSEEFIHKSVLRRSDEEYEEFINNNKESEDDDDSDKKKDEDLE